MIGCDLLTGIYNMHTKNFLGNCRPYKVIARNLKYAAMKIVTHHALRPEHIKSRDVDWFAYGLVV